jgi:hypothetical protein
MKNLTNYLAIILLGIGCILYPMWLDQGYLDTDYAKIAVALVCYGGVFANIVYIIRNR